MAREAVPQSSRRWRRRLLIALALSLLVLLGGLYAVEVSCNRPLFFWWHTAEVISIRPSPSGRYRLIQSILAKSGQKVLTVDRPWWVTPLPAGPVAFSELPHDPAQAARLPTGPQKAEIVWSRNERYIAAATDGWYTLLYEIPTQQRWQREVWSDITLGKTAEETRRLNRIYTSYDIFHDEVQHKLDSDGGAIAQE